MIYPDRQPLCDGEPATSGAPSCCCNSTENAPTSVVENAKPEPTRNRWSSVTSFMLSIGVVFFPKCPLCWAAYMSLFSFLGLDSIGYQPWMLPAMIGLLMINLALLGYAVLKKRAGAGPLVLGIIGVAFALSGKFLFDLQSVIYAGLALVLLGTAWNAMPRQVDWVLNYLKNKFGALQPAAQKEAG